MNIKDMMATIYSTPTGRLYELVKADMEGRVNILPVKVGDPVYVLYWTKDKEHYHITESVCNGIHITGDIDQTPRRKCKGKQYIIARTNGFFKHLPMHKLGETWFLSLNDAVVYASRVDEYAEEL